MSIVFPQFYKSLKPELRLLEQRIVPKTYIMKVELTNGGFIHLRSTCPRPYVKLSRDTYNSPLWLNEENVQETTELNQFRKKYKDVDSELDFIQ